MTKPVDYSTWTKEQLIEKLNKLENLPEKELTTKNKPSKEFNWDKYNFRFVALKFAYLGWNYNGLAFQYEPTPLPTIEETLLRCLSKIKLIKEPILETEFSRCGRTDKGVSAMNQVISMKLRSNLTIEEQQDPINDDKEIDYLTVINANLPPDIKIHSICLRPPPNFDARFSCKNRHYKYLFRSKDLNIQAMQEAASYYEGEHDFRNFCKLDGSKQITNFNRFIYSSKIKNLKDDLYYFDLIGTAFLWHQVRCMIAILFLVGKNLEKPEIIKELMDISIYPTKPQYEMANDIPLVLYNCEFPPMEWKSFNNQYKFKKIMNSFIGMEYDLGVKSQLSEMMENLIFNDIQVDSNNMIPLGDGIGRAFTQYQPLSKRERTDDYQIINARWMERKNKKKNPSS